MRCGLGFVVFFFSSLAAPGGGWCREAAGFGAAGGARGGSPPGFGEPGGVSAPWVRPRPCRLLQSVKLFPSPSSAPRPARLHMVGCKEVGGWGRHRLFLQNPPGLGQLAASCGVPCWRARTVGIRHGGVWGALPGSVERGAMVTPSVPGGVEGQPRGAARGDTGVTPGHADVAGGWRRGGRARAQGAGRKRRPRSVSPGSWHGLGGVIWGGGHPSPLRLRHQCCGAAFALSLSIADIYLIIEQGPLARNRVPAGSRCPHHIQPWCRTPRGLCAAGGAVGGWWHGAHCRPPP